MDTSSILIIDDNKGVLDALELLLDDEFEKVKTITNPNLIPSLIGSDTFDVYLLDMNFTGSVQTGNEGMYWMDRIREMDPEAVIVFITAYGEVDIAVNALKKGAFDFITKPWENQQLISTLHAATKYRKSTEEVKKLRTKESSLKNYLNMQFPLVKGESIEMKRVYDVIEKVAPTQADILILGENGTGKEVIAREIHKNSMRCDEIFLSVDIASFSEGILESELFGHKKGAFTDAREDRTGKFEAATGGTLFLDEIGNLSLTTQAKLLSAIQTRRVTPVGSNKSVPVDIRLLCATNSNLEQKINDGSFREDLFYRINTVTINLPPLRERKEDILHLANYYLEHFSRKYNRSGISFTPKLKKDLINYHWKGNVRELRHSIERAVILSDSPILNAEDLHLSTGNDAIYKEDNHLTLEAIEKKAIAQAIKHQNGNMTNVAAELGITRQTLYNKIKRYDL